MQDTSSDTNSLSSWESLRRASNRLESLIAAHPKADSEDVQKILQPKAFDEKEYDRNRKRQQRASGRELYIPVPKNIPLRLACLQDPELLLTTYFPETYFEPFTADRRDMLLSIWRAARYGGDQAIAGSRGEGKTTLAMDGAFCLMLAGLSFFPVIIGKNQDAASDELKAIRERIAQSERFVEDFPEIGVPLQSVGPQAGNARLQTVGGQFVGMYLGPKHFAFPKITNEMLPHWPADLLSVASGQVLGATGIEGRVRGFKFRSHRPTIALIDDIEDKDSANSDLQIEKNEKTIEEDIGGMGSSAERIARVYLCTTLNRKCNAYRYTCRKTKPSWNGRRYRKMIKRPDRMDLVEEYIGLREMRGDDDPDARVAFRYWRDNREEIERGCEISNPYSYSKKQHEDGEPIELSAIQAYFNRVADMGEKAVATEIDNDPPETAGPQGNGLTWETVAGRISGLDRMQLPANASLITAGFDLGKYHCHWVVVAWWKGAGGCVIDYGVAEVRGNDVAMDNESSEPQIYRAMLNWRDELLSKQYVDAAGAQRKVDAVFVDSGTFTDAAYEFVRQVGSPFYAAKGIGNYKSKTTRTDKIVPGNHLHASYQESQKLWLYEMDASYWKQWVHERFLTPTFDEQNFLRRGALSLFSVPNGKKHLSFAKHITAEELVQEFKEGKGTKTYWNSVSNNNHWLDATYNAAAAAGANGIYLLSGTKAAPDGPQIEAKRVDQDQKKAAKPASQQHGRFKSRPGGWVAGLRR